MITCYLRYKIDMYKVAEFEKYARMWILKKRVVTEGDSGGRGSRRALF